MFLQPSQCTFKNNGTEPLGKKKRSPHPKTPTPPHQTQTNFILLLLVMCCYTSFEVFSSQGFKKNNLKINFIYQNLKNMRSVDGEV